MIQIRHGQDDVLAPQDDEHPAALRGQVLLGVPALIQQVVKLGVGQILLRDPGFVQHHRGHEQVDVVTAQVAQPVRGQNLVRGADDVDQGGIERAPSQVVDQDPGALGGDGCRLAMRVLETCGAGLVEHGSDAEASPLEGLQGQQALGPIGVGGYRNDCAGPVDVHILLRQLCSQVAQVAGENLQGGEGLLAQCHRGGGGQRGGCQNAFEAT